MTKFAFLFAVLLCALTADARDISGSISTTLTITDNSQFVGDVTCTVSGAACIAIGAPGITLDLNGFTMTGLGDSETGCAGQGTAGEFGIDINGQNSVVIRGPGLIQRFRNTGVILRNSVGGTISAVTASTNCFSGILVSNGSDHVLENNVSVRNGNSTSPCGGI